MNWCPRCGEQIQSSDGAHNCGTATVSKDRLRELERIEREAISTQSRGAVNDGS